MRLKTARAVHSDGQIASFAHTGILNEMNSTNAVLLFCASSVLLFSVPTKSAAQVPEDSVIGAAALASDAEGDFVIGPDYTNAPETRANPNVPRERFIILS